MEIITVVTVELKLPKREQKNIDSASAKAEAEAAYEEEMRKHFFLGCSEEEQRMAEAIHDNPQLTNSELASRLGIKLKRVTAARKKFDEAERIAKGRCADIWHKKFYAKYPKKA